VLANRAFNSAFNHPDGAILSLAATLLAKWGCLTADAVDKLFGDPRMKASKDLVNPLLRTFNIALSGERTPYTSPNQILKKAALVDVGNCLFRLYFKVGPVSPAPGSATPVHCPRSSRGVNTITGEQEKKFKTPVAATRTVATSSPTTQKLSSMIP
jgi:hypothetical protein